MRLKPSSPLTYLLILALLTGGGLLYSVTRPSPTTVGALEVSPASLTVPHGEPTTLRVRNVGPSAITVRLEPPPFVSVDPVSAVVAVGRTLEVKASAVPTFVEGGGDLTVMAGTDEVVVPVTLSGTPPNPVRTAALQVAEPTVEFPRGVSVVSRTLVNATAETATWEVPEIPDWLTLTPNSGTIEPTKAAVISFAVDRSRLRIGETSRRIDVRSPVGDAAFEISVTTGPDPVISLPTPVLDFGVGGRKTVKTLSFEIRNAGNAELRYQASADRVFLKLGTPASGVIQPGKSAKVDLTFDFAETRVSYDWTAEVPISSNGGSAVLQVVAVSDWSAPTMIVGSNQMDVMHDHCASGSCERYRHLHVTLEDPNRIILMEVAFQICTGSGESPTCDEWRKAPDGERVSGTDRRGDYESEIGPLPKTCVPGVGVIINYRLKLADSLLNSSLRPGSSTHYGYLHCSRS